jgi:hypothetical protein
MEKLKQLECQQFQNNYCKSDEGTYSSDNELYTNRVADFKTLVEQCYGVCQTEDMDNLRKYRRIFYETLYDILIRNNVLQKITGGMTDPLNSDKYHYLIKYNTEATIANINISLDAFSTMDPSHENLIFEMHSFLEILNLEVRKFVAKEQISKDGKEEMIASYQARHYEIIYNTVQPDGLVMEEVQEEVVKEET